MITRNRLSLLIFTILVIAAVFSAMAMVNPAFVELKRESAEEEPPVVLFSHWEHQELFKCYTCHQSIFSYEKQIMTHDHFDEGKYCSVCHDGKISWEIGEAECEACHKQ